MNKNEEIKRAKLILKTPNPLFEAFVEEFIHEAKAKGFKDRLEQYEKALISLKKYPLQLRSGKDCIILEHFDARLCVKLDMKLKHHSSTPLVEQNHSRPNSAPVEQNSSTSVQRECLSQLGPKQCDDGKTGGSHRVPKKRVDNEENQVEKGNTGKTYIPSFRSAAYAILVSLFNNEKTVNYKGFMTKAELQADAQQHCDTSLKKARAGTFYTGWSSVSLLTSKGLISKKSSPAKFSLTDSGRELAERLIRGTDSQQNPSSSVSESSSQIPGNSPTKATKGKKTTASSEENDKDESSQPTSASSSLFETEDMVFLPNTFEVILLLDTAETVGGPRKDDPTEIELTSLNVKFEIRQLKVGDFVWIARDTLGRELVLPYIVERKRLDDLAKSIKDGRFEEQKFRLTESGVSNIIYLFEETGSYEHLGLPYENLLTAMTNTMITENFLVKITDGHLHSMRFLANVTSILASVFQNKTLISGRMEETAEMNLHDDTIILQTFADFFDNMGKNRDFTVQEIFVKQLIQLHGMSADKALAVADRFGTPKGLMDHFAQVRDDGRSVSLMEYGDLNRKIGPTLGAVLYKFYTASSFD